MAPASRKGKQRAVDQDTGTSKKRQQQKQAQRDADTADDSDELLSFNGDAALLANSDAFGTSIELS